MPADPRSREARHAIVVADGDVGAREALDRAWPGWDDSVAEVIAADGGFARARALGFNPATLVGDLDSLDPALADEAARTGTTILRARPDKDESDAELAILEACRRGATRVTVLGAFGGPRLDHALANVWLLAHPGLRGTGVVLLDERTRLSLLTAPGPGGEAVSLTIPGRVGATISLLPFGGDAIGITTRGLRYPLRREPLVIGPARGLSNVRVAADASVTLERGRVLVVEGAA